MAPTPASTIVPEVLGENNYETWSILIRHYLEANDVWEVVESSTRPRSGNWKDWKKKNACALLAIKISCGAEMLDRIKEKNSAHAAWNALADMKKPQAVYHNVAQLHEVVHGDIIESHEGRPQAGHGNLRRTQIVTLLNDIYEGKISKVERFFLENPNARSAILLENGHASLLVAITAGKEALALKLISMLSREELLIQDNLGNTSLSLAARNGMKRSAMELVIKNHMLLAIRDNDGKIPLELACSSGHAEVTSYLYNKTQSDLLDPKEGKYHGLNLLQECIANKMFDIALELLNKFPKLIRYRSYMASPLLTFASRSQGPYNSLAARGVLRFILKELSKLDQNQLVEIGAVKAAFEAIKHGNLDFFISITKANPDILWSIDPDDSTDMLAYAIEQRQEEITRFLFGFGAWKDINARNMTTDEEGNNMLHQAAKLVPDFQLSRICGAALQLQNELRWFKAVQSIVPQCYKDLKNKDGYTPSEIFPREHQDLRKKAEKWMKETAKSSTVVGGFIITIMFAAAFTTPGGNDQVSGFPIFLSRSKGENKIMFMLFMVSDALSLVSSASAVLMFLGFHTSRYNWQDFLKSLPIKLVSGIFLLLISTAAMMIAFCAALLTALRDRWLVFIPISVLTGIPVILFWMSKFRLLVKINTLSFRLDIFEFKRNGFLHETMISDLVEELSA